jgi:hypothetical protein
MSPITHLLASWIVAAKTTDNPRDCRLVALAGILPDADGLGIVIDVARNFFRQSPSFFYYQEYHHWLWHGAFGAVVTATLLAWFARRHWRVWLLCLLVFHLHLLCDLLGSRGPSPNDFWPIFYFGPFSHHPMWIWHGQWRLDGWQNRLITLALMLWALWMASSRNDSVVGVFNRRADKVFVGVLRKWRAALLPKRTI